jgi:group I intron endonuclease
MVIYKVVNNLNGKIYIGQDSKDNPAYLGSGELIKKAVAKYGFENFKKTILEQITDLSNTNERETFWIKHFDSTDLNKGYNLNKEGGKPPKITDLPKEQQDQIRQNWSEQRKGKKRDEEYRENHSKIMSELYKNKDHPTKGRKCSEAEIEFRRQKALKEGLGGDVFNKLSEEKQAELREKARKRNTGRQVSEETRKKISETLKQSYKNGKRPIATKSGL